MIEQYAVIILGIAVTMLGVALLFHIIAGVHR